MVKVVVDSGANIPTDHLEKYRIGVIPLIVVLDDNQEYPDGVIDSEAVISAQKAGRSVGTSAPSVGYCSVFFEKLIREGHKEIIVITIPTHSSLTYGNILEAASSINEIHKGKVRIEVVDSLNVSMAQGFLALRVAELIERGANLGTAVDFANSYRHNLLLLVALETPKFAGQGGRVKAARAYVGAKLGLRPPVQVIPGEEAKPLGHFLVRSKEVSKKRILEEAAKFSGSETQYAVVYAPDALKDAGDTHRRLCQMTGYPEDRVIVAKAPAALLVHAGYGAFGIAVDAGKPIVP